MKWINPVTFVNFLKIYNKNEQTNNINIRKASFWLRPPKSARTQNTRHILSMKWLYRRLWGYKATKMADALRLQMNIRQNAEELQDILQDLNKWEDEMKTKDNELLNSKIVHKQVWL